MTALASDLDPGTAALADRLVALIASGDVDGVASCFSDDAVVWHNDDGLVVPATKVLPVLAWLARHVSDLRYDVTRRDALADGYVQQHVLRGTTRSGEPLALAACLIVRVADGRITAISEYYDSAATAVLRA